MIDLMGISIIMIYFSTCHRRKWKGGENGNKMLEKVKFCFCLSNEAPSEGNSKDKAWEREYSFLRKDFRKDGSLFERNFPSEMGLLRSKVCGYLVR